MGQARRESYHHGELRQALIDAAEEIIRDNGLEGFSLREAARRAGVSPGAPAHHFGSVTGLLTQVAIAAFDRMAEYMRLAPVSGEAGADLRGVATAYAHFAKDHPGQFVLTRRKDMVDRLDPEYQAAAAAATRLLLSAAARYHGASWPQPAGEPIHPGIHAVLASAHGVAYLANEGEWYDSLDRAPTLDFDLLLPGILRSLWPDRS